MASPDSFLYILDKVLLNKAYNYEYELTTGTVAHLKADGAFERALQTEGKLLTWAEVSELSREDWWLQSGYQSVCASCHKLRIPIVDDDEHAH